MYPDKINNKSGNIIKMPPLFIPNHGSKKHNTQTGIKICNKIRTVNRTGKISYDTGIFLTLSGRCVCCSGYDLVRKLWPVLSHSPEHLIWIAGTILVLKSAKMFPVLLFVQIKNENETLIFSSRNNQPNYLLVLKKVYESWKLRWNGLKMLE